MSYSKRSTNSRLIVALLIGVLIGVVISLHGLGYLPYGHKGAAFAISIAFFLIAILFLLSLLFKDRLLRYLFGENYNSDDFIPSSMVATKELTEVIVDRLSKNAPEEVRSRIQKLAPLIVNTLVWGRIRNWWFKILIAVFVAIGGLASTVLLLNQNELINSQNDKIQIQTQLMEADRRSSLLPLLTAILNDIDYEIEEQRNGKPLSSIKLLESTGYTLSSPLIGKISATCLGLLPYRILKGDSLSEKEWSVERGQLFLAIVNSNLSDESITKINNVTVYSSAYLRNTRLMNVNLFRAALDGVDLSYSRISDTNISRAYLRNSYLMYTSFSNSNLSYSNLSNSDLRNAKFSDTDLRNANLSKSSLAGVEFWNTKLVGVNLKGANLKGVDLSNTDFSLEDSAYPINTPELTLVQTNFSNANLEEANLSNSDLSGANLSGANLDGANMQGTILYGADLRGVKNVTEEQLLSCKVLYNTEIDSHLVDFIRTNQPCLFTKTGCE